MFLLLFGIVCPGVLIFCISIIFLHSGVFLQCYFFCNVCFLQNKSRFFFFSFFFFCSVIFFVMLFFILLLLLLFSVE